MKYIKKSFNTLLFLLCSLLLTLHPDSSEATDNPPLNASSPGNKKNMSPPIICIDPGHPSETGAGDTVLNGVKEVDIVFDVACELQKELSKRGVKSVMTKKKRDEYVTNKQRAEIANNAGAALMLRLHCESAPGTGYTVYYPDREGRVGEIKGPPEEIRRQSKKAAGLFHAGFRKSIGHLLKDNGVKGDSSTYIGSKQGALTGSIHALVPVILIEMVVLSNKKDAEFIKNKKSREKLILALADGIETFLAATGQ